MNEIFSKLIGTLAVLLLVAAFIGSTDYVLKHMENSQKKWKHWIVAGLIGGLFGIYGNISGFELNGAVISVRDIGPMLAGFISGPVGGLIAGIIAGVHRLTMGGLTAQACVVATCCIGLICGFVSLKWHEQLKKPYFALILSTLMELMHLGIVLIMVKPFESALSIVKQIIIPFVIINAVGFALLIIIITRVEEQRRMLVEKSRMESELEVATVIQHSLLPIIDDAYPGVKETDVGAYMHAAKEVGGDFYDVFFVDGDRIAFLIGDVSGKGVPAAMFMATAKMTLQNCIRDISSLSEAVAAANNSLCNRNEAEMFVTIWVGVLNIRSGEVTYVNAGHNNPVLVQNDKADYIRTENDFVLAGMEDMTYNEYTLTMHKGDIIYIYTDGVTEANTSDKELFGDDRLLACFEGAKEMTAQTIIDTVREQLESFVQGNDQFDDITMLCFKFEPEQNENE